MFARAAGYSDPLFFDENYAKSKGHHSIPTPPGFLGHMIHDPLNPLPEGGGEVRDLLPGARILNGGTDIEYFDTICAGDVLTVTAVPVADVQEREGRQGHMIVIASRTTYKRGEQVVAIHRGTLIFY
jgi:hypothetical protein